MDVGEELATLGALLLIAYVFGRLGKLIGLPVIPVYMLVGVLASPHVGWFPLNLGTDHIELIAVIGLILLLFNLGLEFDQDEFFGNAGSLLLSGGTRIAINMGVGFAFGMWVGWGTREALIIAGMTATSSSAIVTKLLIELKRLPNRETPVILGVAVVEDVFIAIYLAIVAVVIGGKTDLWPIVLELTISFTFLVAMFAIARWGGRVVSRLIQTKDDELFTILFFGLAVAFGGIGEMLGVSDAIGAFLIGLVLGATRYRGRIEQLALPMRDIFGAFFFLNFGLTLNPATFGSVLWPVTVAVVMTLVVNTLGGQLIAWLNKLNAADGFNVAAMLQNRGEFALILATLATSAGLDQRLTPFAGLYVLSMAIIGPILAVNSERFGAVIFRTKKKKSAAAQPSHLEQDENIALMEAALAGRGDGDNASRGQDSEAFAEFGDVDFGETDEGVGAATGAAADPAATPARSPSRAEAERLIEDAMRESGDPQTRPIEGATESPAKRRPSEDEPRRERERDPEY
ncbi:MAG: cation:proton antiporter [Lacisediminihabitans sp.]